MRAVSVFTEPVSITNITECSITKIINNHFEVMITGYIREDQTDEANLNQMMNTTFIVKALNDKNEEFTLFRGIIHDIRLYTEGGLKRITVSAASKTSILDRTKHIRTFQGEKQTYGQIINQVSDLQNNVAIIYSKGKEARAKGLVVQYEETDWEFFKRLASQLNTVLVADCTNDHICFYFGNPQKRGENRLETAEYKMRRYMDYKAGESIEYIFQSREIMNLCECVYVNDNSYYVYEVKGNLINKELLFNYTLRPLSGFLTEDKTNDKIAGITITGKVINIRETDVIVQLFSEMDYNFGKSIWFPYATVYSSPDGTGWYCMPEKGDQIRLHIPDNREHKAYVISSVHLDNDNNLRKNVNVKSIRTKYDKEIRFTPEKILITNHKGISITLDDKKGVIIKSNRKIELISETGIEMKGEQVLIEGEQGVYLMEGPNFLMVRDGIKEHGRNIEHR